MWLLLIAIFGLVFPNGLFIYWLFFEFHSIHEVANNHLAIAFVVDAFMAVGLLAYFYSKNPPGRYRWYWFIIFSLIGGLGFSIPFYIWLNQRAVRPGK